MAKLEVPDHVRDGVYLRLTTIAPSTHMAFYTYIMACRSNTAIYVGVTGNLLERVAQHKLGKGGTHTAKYNITKLVYFEIHETLDAALARERKLKRWRRAWKEDLVKATNPSWSDLSMEASFL